MWGSFLDRGKELAAQAKQAALELDKHLNESVGVVSTDSGGGADIQSTDDTVQEDLNDAWDEDEEAQQKHDDAVNDQTPAEDDEQPASAVKDDEEVAEGETKEKVEDEPVPVEEEVASEQQAKIDVVEFADTPVADTVPTQEGWDGDVDDVDLDDEVNESTTPQDAGHDQPQESPEEETPEVSTPLVQPEPDTPVDPVVVEEEPAEPSTMADSIPVPAFGSLFGNLAALVNQPLVARDDDEEPLRDEVMSPMDDEVDTPIEEDVAATEVLAKEKIEVDTLPSSVDETDVPNEVERPELVEPTARVQAVDEPAIFAAPSPNVDNAGVAPEHVRQMEAQLAEMQERLQQRETQLLSKTEQLAIIEKMHETEKKELIQKVQATKDEAKRRIQKAKERVDAVELKLKNLTVAQSSSAEDAGKQAEIIDALRAEGEKLARKQADMEAAVRAAKGEARELHVKLEETEVAKEKALVKIATLEVDLKSTRDDLSSARLGESQAGKLDVDLRNVREESEKRATTIMTLEQEIKELKATQKELRGELSATRKGAAVETEQERKKLITEHNHLVSDLETKLRSQERDAGVREDALRQEVDELRKRWQDAVRRADSLSVDVQSSTAPLLRQLESTNKQNRARASAWAELETQLRTELEESVIQNEKLTKERGELKTKCTRLERSAKENETEIKQIKGELHDKTERVRKLEHQLAEMETEGAKQKAEWAEVERLANEGVSRVRSEMTRTVVDAEERHRMQMDSLESQLRQERDQRTQLEQQVQGLLENTGVFTPSVVAGVSALPVVLKETTPKKLRHSQGQAEILSGALGGIGGDDEDDEDDDENDIQNNGTSSFAALEQLTSSLKATKLEVTSLRTRLADSEKTREDLVQVLAESRNAREKLPLFEARVQELTVENRELTQEVLGLREDIADVRELYRGQLNALLEAQAVATTAGAGNTLENGHTSDQTDSKETMDPLAPASATAKDDSSNEVEEKEADVVIADSAAPAES